MTESVISSERDKTLENTSCVPEKYIRGTLNINDRNINIRVGKNFRRSTANLFRRMVEEKMVERGKDPALVSKRLERKSKQLAGSFSKQVDEELQNVLNHLSIELWASHLVVEAVKKTLSSFIEDHADILDMDKLDPIVDPSLWVTTDREIRIKRITDGVSYDAKTAVEVAYSNTKV